MHESPPLVLIASRDEWTTRSLESVLAPAGFAITRAYGSTQAIRRARDARPDVVLLGTELAAETGASLARRLRDEAVVSPSTPILLLHPHTVSHADRLEALAAGAWDVLAFPVDTEELVARLGLYASAKRDAAAAHGRADVLPEADVFTRKGLLRRGAELAAYARRTDQPLACVLFAADAEQQGASGDAPDIRELATVFRQVGRQSDVIGVVDPTRLAVLAIDTDTEGARGLARRLSEALPADDATALRTGWWAASDASATPADAGEILRRAARALDA